MIRLALKEENFILENERTTGETIEEMVRRMVNNGEPIGNPVPLIYTERKDGVLPQYDIRADKYDIAIDSMNHASKAHRTKREERIKTEASDTIAPKETLDNPQ